ncbi:MAG: PAS domain-containing protein, partial [Phycisphaerales bacterium]|nr:PAS domain-containing protein [Phycisphaerales bacterium]
MEPSYLVCLGASAGGLEALESFFASVPANTDAAFVIISHLSPDFKSLMPELLSRHTKMAVRTATDGMAPERNTISIIPPGKNMAYRSGRLRLESQDRTGAHVLQLPVDIFLRSVAEERPHRSVAVILSGTGSDGSRGIRVLKESGGMVLAQQPESARFDGMPRAAIDMGVVDASGTPPQLASFVLELIRTGVLREPAEDDDTDAMEVLPVLESLRTQLHQDVSYLRPRMLRRRTQRRMALLGIKTIAEYADRLMTDAAEARSLKQDTMIGVTSFFRDAEAFRFLQRHLSVSLARSGEPGPFRVWVPACSSGEEVFSLAILLHEHFSASDKYRDIKIFATDLDEDSLARASKATYPASCAEDIGLARAGKYFTSQGDKIVVRSFLREMVIFAQHNLVRDPPFTRIDLISCRNFLIYLTPESQVSVLASLHFALNQRGTLFLGSAESIGKLDDEFDTVDSRFKVYTKSKSATLPSMRLRSGLQDPGLLTGKPLVLSTRDRERDTTNRQVLEMMVEREARSVAILTPDGALSDIVSDAAEAFRVPRGRMTSDIARMLEEPLVVAVTTGLQRLRRGESDAQFVVEMDRGGRMSVRLTSVPAVGNSGDRVLLLIEPAGVSHVTTHEAPLTVSSESAERMNELQNELMQTRENLQSTIEELQSANEEQQSTNEELMASNEELQSTNEELQSVNEELFTVNVEYQNKIQELAVVAADLNNLLRNINVGILFLDADLRVRRFTPSIEQVVKLVDHDIGRSIEHFAHTLGPDFLSDVRRVLNYGEPIERDARSATGNWLLVRILPYLTQAGKPNGVVASFFDVTPIRNANEMTRVANDHLAFANEELASQRRELEEMFSIVANDLKRPVIALAGLLDVIRNDKAITGGAAREKAPTGEGRPTSLMERAQSECHRMRQMLLDLESLSGIQQRAVEFERVEAQVWLDDLVHRASEGIDTIRVHCTCDPGDCMIARSFLEEIFSNIFENALKYGCTSESPRIDVSGRIREQTFELSISDNGKGIAPEHQSKVFEPFRRLD